MPSPVSIAAVGRLDVRVCRCATDSLASRPRHRRNAGTVLSPAVSVSHSKETERGARAKHVSPISTAYTCAVNNRNHVFIETF